MNAKCMGNGWGGGVTPPPLREIKIERECNKYSYSKLEIYFLTFLYPEYPKVISKHSIRQYKR
jgi:hypothetical protein